MSIPLHSIVVRDYVHMLKNIQLWLDKAQAFATAKPFDSANYLPMRLAPDMLPFTTQVMVACEVAKMGVSRLTGSEAPKLEQQDANLQDLRQRLEHTIGYLESFSPEQVDANPPAEVVVPQRGKPALTFDAPGFVLRWSQPNFFFHATTIYALLRQAGVDVGKADFLGIH